MAEMNASVLVNMEGNLERRAQRYQRALGQFSRKGTRDLGRMRRMTGALGTGLDRLGSRYTALLTGVGGGLAIRNVVRLEERFTRLGIAAGATDERMEKLKQQIFDTAQASDVRIDPSRLTEAVAEIVERTGDLGFAERNLRGMALALQATAAAGKDIGGIGAELQKAGIDDFMKMTDILATQGKEGAFTAQHFARMGGRLFSTMFANRPASEQTVRELGAVMQVIRRGTGNAEQATTAFEALMRTLQDSKKIEMLRAGGIKVFDQEALKEGREVLRPVNELMVEIIERTDGRTSMLSEVFDAEAMRAFNSAIGEYRRTGAVESLEKFMNIQADGSTLMKDSARAADDASAALTSIATAAERFADVNLAGPIQEVADALNSLDPDQLQQIFEVMKWGGIVLGGLYAARKVQQGARGIGDMLGRGGGGRGGAGGLIGELGQNMKPIPVYVVNKGFGGAGRGGVGGAAGKAGRSGRILRPSTGRLVRAAPGLRTIGAMGAGAMGTAGLLAGGAGLAGYGVGTGIDKGLQQFEGGRDFRHGVGRELAKVLAIFGSDSARAALDADIGGRNAGRSQLDIRMRIDKDGNPTSTDISSDDRDVNLDVDSPLTMGIMP